MIREDDLVDSGEIADMLGVSESTFRSMRSQPERHRRIDGLPEPLRTVGRVPVWEAERVLAWWVRSAPTVMVPATEGGAIEGLPATATRVTRRGARLVIEFDVWGERWVQEWRSVRTLLRNARTAT